MQNIKDTVILFFFFLLLNSNGLKMNGIVKIAHIYQRRLVFLLFDGTVKAK